MRRATAASAVMLVGSLVCHPAPARAQVDQARAEAYFKEAQALCARDDGRLWGVSVCAPMVIGDARTRTFATSQPAPSAPRPAIIGLLNGPIQWGDTMWAALSWDTVANWPAQTRGEAFLHESFHILQQQHKVPARYESTTPGASTENEHLDSVDGRVWLRLEWRALAAALRASGAARRLAVRDALAFRQARHARFPDHVESERAQDINEGIASYTGTVLAASSAAAAVTRAIDLLTEGETGDSFVRTFAYTSGPAYGVLLDTASPRWPRKMHVSDDPAAMLARALQVEPAADAAATALRYGGAEVRAGEERREQQRRARIAELRGRFIEAPVFVMPGGGGGYTDSHGATVVPGAGTVYFGAYRMSGEWGSLEAEKGVLIASDERSRHLPAPVPGTATTISGDGWTFRAAAGWVIRPGPRSGDYEVVRQQP